MKEILVPTTDVNSETCSIAVWHVEDCQQISKGDLIAEVETSKALIEVFANESGMILRAHPVGKDISLSAPIAYVFPSEDKLNSFKEEQNKKAEAKEHSRSHYRATKKAQELADKQGLDLASIDKGKLITTKEVENLIAASTPIDYDSLPAPLTVEEGVERVLVIGGGLGATQVIDIFRDHPNQKAVALVDESRDTWGNEVYGVPVVGGSDRIGELLEKSQIDSAIVSISTSIPARKKFRELCASLGLKMTNAIDKTAKVAADVKMGDGNVVCAFCHFGTGTEVGDNNFFSAYNSYDHHCTLGSDISTGPGCMASGIVKFGDRVRLGTGIYFEPYIEIGDDVIIASGTTIVNSVPKNHTVKAKSGKTAVVPRTAK
ncbi:bifunctional N-acetylglucosamine-1-phosphate uridyltransferase/glucosamine-1-phosphate acetyltransferase [bacterium J17]|nr:bifunctional N-acetylglucosamine-1-phosphate uridyltransferase/glucosamine-1-phosphate acetyltransferase [bacterium J17]